MMLDPFYPIVENYDWLGRLLPEGVRLVQLRNKTLAGEALRVEIAKAKRLCQVHGAQLIVNDHWELAIDEGCDFVHLGQEDLDDADMNAIRKANIRVGISTHDRAELDRALSQSPDYVALGPIYPTILKKMKWHQQGLDRLSVWRSLVGEVPLVAIGGFSIDRAAGAYSAGADIVAAVTDITLHENPEQRTRDWVAATRDKP